MNLLIDSGTGLVLSMVCLIPSIEQRKQVYNCKANNVGAVHTEMRNLLEVLTGACLTIVMAKQLNCG